MEAKKGLLTKVFSRKMIHKSDPSNEIKLRF